MCDGGVTTVIEKVKTIGARASALTRPTQGTSRMSLGAILGYRDFGITLMKEV
jgi:hypothetical protein